MFVNYGYDEKGYKNICNTENLHANMLMDIAIKQMKKGEKIIILNKDKETAVMLVNGSVTYHWNDKVHSGSRISCFEQKPHCLHVCKNVQIEIEADEDSEVLIQATYNDKIFQDKMYTPDDCKLEHFGGEQWGGTAKRRVLTIFDYDNAPYSNMVIGEVINLPGKWSSYIPHSHTQPEVYYYKFSKPQGFGASFIGENAYKITDSGASIIHGGVTHPQVTAPGYSMYYCWMIRHLDGDPWNSRDNDPDHVWLLDEE